MINNLCKEILLPSINLFGSDYQCLDNFYELSTLPAFDQIIRNVLPPNTKQGMSLSANLDVLSKQDIHVLLNTAITTKEYISIEDFIEMFLLMKEHISDYKHIIDLAMHQININDIMDKFDTKYGLNDYDFNQLLSLTSFQNITTLGLDLVSTNSHFKSIITEHILNNYLKSPDETLIRLKKFVSVNSTTIPLLKNSFVFCDKTKGFTALNDNSSYKTTPFNFFNYQKNTYHFRIKYAGSIENNSWLNFLSHAFYSNNKEKITSFDFVNIANCLASTIYILQFQKHKQELLYKSLSKSNNSNQALLENRDDITEENFLSYFLEFTNKSVYLNNHFLNAVIQELNTFIQKDGFKNYQATQLISLIYLLEDSISTMNPFTHNLEYFSDFYKNCELLISKLQNQFPDLIKDKKYNLSRYSLILHNLFDELEPQEDVLVMSNNLLNDKFCPEHVIFDKKYFLKEHLLVILDEYPFDFTFSYTSLIDQKLDFDAFGNCALASRVFLDAKNNTSQPLSNNISIAQQIHNTDIVHKLLSEDFTLINSLNDFTDIHMLYEYGNKDIKLQISNEMKKLIKLFTTPIKTQAKFCLHSFFQFNLAQDKDLITTSIFQQMLFKDSSIGFATYIPLFFSNTKDPIFFQYLDNENISPILEEFKKLLSYYYDNEEGINLFPNNQHWFFDKTFSLENYLSLVKFISEQNFDPIFKSDIINFHKKVEPKIFAIPLGDLRKETQQAFDTINLKLQLLHKENIVRVKNKL